MARLHCAILPVVHSQAWGDCRGHEVAPVRRPLAPNGTVVLVGAQLLLLVAVTLRQTQGTHTLAWRNEHVLVDGGVVGVTH